MAVSDTIKRIYASAPLDGRLIETLALKNSHFSNAFFLTNDDHEWSFNLENDVLQVFQPAPFVLKAPTNNTEGGQELNITFANLGRSMLDELEAAASDPGEPIIAEYRIYTNIENSYPQNDPVLTMSIYGISIEAAFVSAVAGRFDILNRRFPRILYNTDYFPGLKR